MQSVNKGTIKSKVLVFHKVQSKKTKFIFKISRPLQKQGIIATNIKKLVIQTKITFGIFKI